MTITKEVLTAACHDPSRKSACVCGSGLKFKRCCAGAYSSEASKRFRDAYNYGHYQDALVQARYHFTWYVLSHKAHIIPLLETGPAEGEKLLFIDINALAAITENLQLCYFQLERYDEFLDVIDNIRNVIKALIYGVTNLGMVTCLPNQGMSNLFEADLYNVFGRDKDRSCHIF